MKVSELTGADLDYWVAKAEGCDLSCGHIVMHMVFNTGTRVIDNKPNYSTSWSAGGPIIERKNIATTNHAQGGMRALPEWCAKMVGNARLYFGPTLLIAAMRAYVASVFGDEVPDVPA